MTTLVARRITPRGLLYLVISGLAGIALIAAFLVLAPNVSADPVNATVCLVSSTGAPLGGGHAVWGNSNYGWGNNIGYTSSVTGCVTGPVQPGYYIAIEYNQNYGWAQTSAPVTDFGQPITFQTSKVTLLNTGSLAYGSGNGGWNSFTGSIEMLPGTYTIANNGNTFNITVGGTDFTGGVLRLLDHNGNGLAGGTASAYCSGWSSLPGATDANGNLVFQVPNSCNNLSVQMNYLGTLNQQSRSQLTASDLTFQTAGVTVRLEDADGNPLDTGYAGYYAGGWRTFGTGALSNSGGATSSGQVVQEMLPGSYSFSMSYNHTLQQLNAVVVSAPTTAVVFQTGRLTVYYSGGLQWNTGEFYTFTKPSMEFLPGTIYLDANNCQTSGITIAAGDHLTKSLILATLRTPGGAPLSGGVATAYVAGTWQTIGTTGSYGACAAFDGQLGNTSVAMVYNGTRQQTQQNQPANSIYAFTTAKSVTIELENSSGQLIDTGDASYYAGGWHDLGNTTGGKVSATILPGTYTFAMTYNGTRQQFSQTITSAGPNNVVFQTTDVTVQLEQHDSNSNLHPLAGGTASYYAGGWQTIGTTDNSGTVSVQMLPGSYSFAMTYNGTRSQQNGVSISGSSTVVDFQTTFVTLRIQHLDGTPIANADASGSYYADGWHTISGTPDVNGQVYVQMLPGTYSFAMTYLGTRDQKAVAVSGATSAVYFQTVQVISDSGNATGYYAQGWQPFTNGMYLLPGSYTFRFSDQANQAYTLSGAATHIH